MSTDDFDGAHLHADATRVLTDWTAPDPGQDRLRQEYLRFLAQHPDAMVRSCRVGHLTSSALMMDEQRTRVLLTLHPKVGRWLQLGGHNEVADASIHAAARREAQEESGIADVVVSDRPLRLDRHAVPCGGAPSEHLDVQYLALVPATAHEVRSEESDDLRWFSLDDLPDDLDDSVARLIAAATTDMRPPR